MKRIRYPAVNNIVLLIAVTSCWKLRYWLYEKSARYFHLYLCLLDTFHVTDVHCALSPPLPQDNKLRFIIWHSRAVFHVVCLLQGSCLIHHMKGHFLLLPGTFWGLIEILPILQQNIIISLKVTMEFIKWRLPAVWKILLTTDFCLLGVVVGRNVTFGLLPDLLYSYM